MMVTEAQNMNEAWKNLIERRSCRKYRAEQIKTEELDAILEAGTYAPTGRGLQTPLIVAVQDPETLKEVQRLNARVMGDENAATFYGAPTVLVVFGIRDNALSTADGNLVIGNLLNAANAVGVDSCYIWRAAESFESEEGKALMRKWGVPEEYRGIGNVILGYGVPEGKRPAAPRKEGYIIKI